MKPEQTILIVEDEKKIAALLYDYFKTDGFNVSVLNRGDQVLSFVQNDPPDLVLLDVMLPGMDGIAVCRQLRKSHSIPIIMLTARVEEADVLLGLKWGADDYICKPFSPREVIARAKAVLRRSQSDLLYPQIKNGSFHLDCRSRDVKIHDIPLMLTPSEYGILEILMTQPGTIFSREELVKKVQGYQFDGYNRTIDTHIKNLRKKIAAVLPDENIIVSVYGAGYKFLL